MRQRGIANQFVRSVHAEVNLINSNRILRLRPFQETEMLKRFMLFVVFAFVAALTITPSVNAQLKATKFRIKDPETMNGGPLYITSGGQERKIYENAVAAWIINDGRDVVFSCPDGAGGFENEGQSLRIYNVASRATRKIFSEYVAVVALKAVKTTNGATALLVRMEDGGLGGTYFAVVDPDRGEVFFRQWAELKAIRGDSVTLGLYHEEDWENVNGERGPAELSLDRVISSTKLPPYKTEQHDLKQLLKGKVIYNRPTNTDVSDATGKMRDVKIFLWNAQSTATNLAFTPVMRRVIASAPLRPTLQMLFEGATGDEQAKGLTSPTFGMKLEAVKIEHGAATIKFSQPPNQTNYGSEGPAIFAQAIERTARQFSTVKQVKICAVGETLIDAQLEKPFAKCPK